MDASVSDAPPRRRERPTRADGMATRERVLKAAAALFAAGGYEATSLRQIAAASEIDLATLKYHFGDKQALFAEVYRLGHQGFLALIDPFIKELRSVSSALEMRGLIRSFTERLQSYLYQSLPFTRMMLFRILENSADFIGLEEELQGAALKMFDSALRELAARGVIRRIDTRAVLALLMTALPMWVVTGQTKPTWLGLPRPDSVEGKERGARFLQDVLERLLLK
ncbi:MAG: TetR/AcrR family transcriptional regulator [Candidatus Schekmanbacteria bacterium]|nr:TetR/AcrR family transcriptional regulator [Candidatus Schekmanbacteria bacterium]